MGTNNKKRGLLYLAYTLVVIIIGLAGNEYLMALREQYFRQQVNVQWVIWLFVLYPILFGMLIALPSFISQFRMTGPWKIDWAKLIGIGVPTLLIAAAGLIFFYSSGHLPGAPGAIVRVTAFLGRAQTLQTACGTIFGFLLLSVFRKEGKGTTNYFR